MKCTIKILHIKSCARYFISDSANFFRWSEEIELVIRNIDARGIERIHRVSQTAAAAVAAIVLCASSRHSMCLLLIRSIFNVKYLDD